MRVRTKDAGQAAFMQTSGALFIQKTENGFYLFESDIKRNDWRSAYAKTELPAFNKKVIKLLNINKG